MAVVATNKMRPVPRSQQKWQWSQGGRLCGWDCNKGGGFRRYAPISMAACRGGPCIKSLSAQLTSVFLFCSGLRQVLAGGKQKSLNSSSSSFSCGERGIRTPGTVIPYGSLANCWFKPLTHLTGSVCGAVCQTGLQIYNKNIGLQYFLLTLTMRHPIRLYPGQRIPTKV